LAALNQGIKEIIIPLANQKDLSDIPKEFKDKMKFVCVENVDEVFAVAFDRAAKTGKKSTSKAGRKPKGSAAASAA
jgi:ATP-dependent Lon protease